MRCNRCHRAIPSAVRFCAYCGASAGVSALPVSRRRRVVRWAAAHKTQTIAVGAAVAVTAFLVILLPAMLAGRRGCARRGAASPCRIRTYPRIISNPGQYPHTNSDAPSNCHAYAAPNAHTHVAPNANANAAIGIPERNGKASSPRRSAHHHQHRLRLRRHFRRPGQ